MVPVSYTHLDVYKRQTQFGYVKRLAVDTYKIQNRGGRGVSGMSRREEDVATEMFVINSHDYVCLLYTSQKLCETFEQSRADDIRNGCTTKGAHRDDAEILINVIIFLFRKKVLRNIMIQAMKIVL